MNNNVLFVDDEPRILEAYKRTLRNKFKVVTAISGAQALEMMDSDGPFPVVVSDMKMPEMNGVVFLSRVKERYPGTVRIMLTGNADQQTAVEAINTGDVYRFLNKPCPPEQMASAVNDALNYFHLLQAEQDLLENTVKGCIKALAEVLSIVSPKIFGHTTLIRGYVMNVAQVLGLKSTWEYEAAALLSQVGCVTLPDSVLERALKGHPITEDEHQLYDKHPEVSANLIDRIPRMEGISEVIRYQNKAFDGTGLPDNSILGEEIPLGARILKPVLDLVAGEASGLSCAEACGRLYRNEQLYDPKVLDALRSIVSKSGDLPVREIRVADLEEGMKLANDVITSAGTLLVSKGHVMSTSMITRLINCWRNGLTAETISVYLETAS